MSDYNSPNYTEQGGARTVIRGTLEIAAGAQVTNAGAQAVAIPDATGGATVDAEARAAINAALQVLRNLGFIAAS